MKLAVTEGQAVQFCLEAGEQQRKKFSVMDSSSEAILVVCEEVNGHWLMSSERQAVTHPSVSSSQVQNLHGKSTAALQHGHDFVFDVAKRSRPYRPLRLATTGEIVIRKR